VLAIVLILLVIFLLIPVGMDIGYYEEELRVWIRAACFTFKIYPQSSKKEKKEPKQKKKDRNKKRTFPNVTKDEILDLIGVAVKSVKKLKFHLHKLKLHFISAFEDPYQTAMVYGYASAAVNAFALPQMKQSDIQLGVDFQREEIYVDGYLSVTIKIYYILKLVCCLVGGVIPILWHRHQRLNGKENSVAVKGKVA